MSSSFNWTIPVIIVTPPDQDFKLVNKEELSTTTLTEDSFSVVVAPVENILSTLDSASDIPTVEISDTQSNDDVPLNNDGESLKSSPFSTTDLIIDHQISEINTTTIHSTRTTVIKANDFVHEEKTSELHTSLISKFEPSDTAESPHFRSANDRWSEAFRLLNKKVQAQFDMKDSLNVSAGDIMRDALKEVESRRNECLKKRWKVVIKGKPIILRDVFNKISGCLNRLIVRLLNTISIYPQILEVTNQCRKLEML
jgi:hypothetical protein